MSYRDELDAAHQRIGQLEHEVARLTRERDELAHEVDRLRALRARDEAAGDRWICAACGGSSDASSRRCRVCNEPRAAAAHALACPRCRARLGGVGVGKLSLDACGRCGGVWLKPQELQELVRLVQSGALEIDPESLDLLGDVPVRVSSASYVRCPQCAEMMQRKTSAPALE